MFKVILKQPWAEMASAGLMTVVHIDAPPKEVPKRIFFHAMEPDHSIGYPIEWLQEVQRQNRDGSFDVKKILIIIISTTCESISMVE